MGSICSKSSRTLPLTQEMIRRLGEMHHQTLRFEYVRNLPCILQKEIWGYLSLREKSYLAKTSKECQQLLNNELMITKMLMLVAQGQQTQADALLTHAPRLLSYCADVTDYSGRTFKHITAYEYAYWAKDWHMCRMLEKHMNDKIKANTHRLCKKMDRYGLTYTQHGVEIKGSKHFDFTPLKDAYIHYLKTDARWIVHDNTAAEVNASWFAIGLMQRDVPAYVANEYCRQDRSFFPTPLFDESNLPRTLTYYFNYVRSKESWFPMDISARSGLGFNFVLVRENRWIREQWWPRRSAAEIDLAAIINLDNASTMELAQSRENLQPLEHTLSLK